MGIDYNLQFIEKKLGEARTAVMYIGGNSVVKLPNDIITFIKVDAAGKLWFAAHKPRCLLREYEQCFPLRLFFYRKGIGFFVETSGIANIAGKDDMAEIKEELGGSDYLIKMTPQLVEYTEIGRKQSFPGLAHRWTSFSKWISDNLTIVNTKNPRLTGMQKTKNYG